MNVLGDVSQVATAAGVLVAGGALAAQYRQRKERLAQHYVDRYWCISDRTERATLGDDMAYLRLCEDEFEVVRLGWIDGGTWEVWHRAIAPEIRKANDESAQELRFVTRCRSHTDVDHYGYACPALNGVSEVRRRILALAGRRIGRALKN